VKIDRNGQAKILSPEEITALFDTALQSPRDRALTGICLYTGCRIGEVCQLPTGNVGEDLIVFPRATTKGKRGTREVPIAPNLRVLLAEYSSDRPYFFPGRWGREHLNPSSADKIFRAAFERVKIVGASSHSFRRTALTQMHRAGIPLRTIQKISGHESLAALQLYLEVSEADKIDAISSLNWR
jgi:integrase/recombinase XerD